MSLLFMLFISNVNAAEIHLEKYRTSHKWYKSPDIVICNDSPVSQSAVESAKLEWEKSGRKIGKITTSKDNCQSKYKKGSILIMGDRDDLDANTQHAVAIRWYRGGSNRKIVESAYIEIDHDVTKLSSDKIKILLTHELGHTLGYKHSKIKNDIMNSDIMK